MIPRLLSSLPILLPCSVPVVVLAAQWSGAPWEFRFVGWVFVVTLLLDFVTGTDEHNRDAMSAAWPLRFATWLWVPLQAAVMLTGLHAGGQSMQTLFVTSIGMGTIAGMLGMAVTHELMHRDNRFEQFLAQLQVTMFGYPHFCIEHIEGHHENVGLRHDPATARIGESLYAFLPRAVFGGFVSAWRIESKRVNAFSIHNRLLRRLLGFVALIAAIGALFGLRGLLFFFAQSAVAILCVEMINYVEHYGIVRSFNEPVAATHSWNSGHRLSNWMLFNVPRHSDHHENADRPWQSLRHANDARQLPAGYFAMFVLALFPPLWQSIMDPLLEAPP